MGIELMVFTKREQQLISLLASGLTNEQIAFEMNIVYRTVCAHLTHIYNKMGMCERSQLMFWLKDGEIKALQKKLDLLENQISLHRCKQEPYPLDESFSP